MVRLIVMAAVAVCWIRCGGQLDPVDAYRPQYTMHAGGMRRPHQPDHRPPFVRTSGSWRIPS